MSRTEKRHRKNGRNRGKHLKHFEDRNYHHLRPRRRGGDSERDNLLLIDKVTHVKWHLVFGNRTLDEVIELIIRVAPAKKAQAA